MMTLVQGNAPLIARLRAYNMALDEGEHDMEMEKLTALIDQENFDHVMSIIPQVDPWIDDDPESPLDTRLIIMSRLILDEQRCIPQAQEHLTKLREDYAELTGDWTAEIEEIDSLLATTSKAQRLNRK